MILQQSLSKQRPQFSFIQMDYQKRWGKANQKQKQIQATISQLISNVKTIIFTGLLRIPYIQIIIKFTK
jgi:hypothetical protein